MIECIDKPGKGAGPLRRAVRDLVAFARGAGRTSCSDTMELRQQCDANTLRVLDALARAKGMERPAYIEALLEEHAKEALHEASLIVRQLRGNPLLVEALGAPLETFGLTAAEEEVGNARATAS